jgi:hypothetical protein
VTARGERERDRGATLSHPAPRAGASRWPACSAEGRPQTRSRRVAAEGRQRSGAARRGGSPGQTRAGQRPGIAAPRRRRRVRRGARRRGPRTRRHRVCRDAGRSAPARGRRGRAGAGHRGARAGLPAAARRGRGAAPQPRWLLRRAETKCPVALAAVEAAPAQAGFRCALAPCGCDGRAELLQGDAPLCAARDPAELER